MSADERESSNLIDVTFDRLHSILSGHVTEGVTLERIDEYLNSRKAQLSNLVQPFGQPSDASRKKIESGKVKLADGTEAQVAEGVKEYIYAISKEFSIDEVQAYIILRSFLYNEGLTVPEDGSLVASELVEAITPFYYSERLSSCRVYLPLFRAYGNDDEELCDVASRFLSTIIPNGSDFAQLLLTEYTKKAQQDIPAQFDTQPKSASRWAKQNLKEQLVLLETLFWTMWGYAPCTGATVVQIYEAAYGSNMGQTQASSSHLLDEESRQIYRDCTGMWLLIMVEVLELEGLTNLDDFEISDSPTRKDTYISSPESLQKIQELVTANTQPQYVCTYAAWSFVLSRLVAKREKLAAIPDSYLPFFKMISPGYTKEREYTHTIMLQAALSPEAGLFTVMKSLLTESPLFVTSAALKRASSITDPNAVAFRSLMKGLLLSILDLHPVELIPDSDGLQEVWTALFGRSEIRSIEGICDQYWGFDIQSPPRRAIFDVARTRFPLYFTPLIRLLRSMSAFGFLDTDPIANTDHSEESIPLSPRRQLAASFAFDYFNKLPTYPQAIPVTDCVGPHPLYERTPERYGSGNSTSLTYTNMRAIKLPGGSILPARSTAVVLNPDAGDHIVVSWSHEHSGWKMILEVLTEYLNGRASSSGLRSNHTDISFTRADPNQPIPLKLRDIGVEFEDDAVALVKDALDLIRSIIEDNPPMAQTLMQVLESGQPVVAHTMLEAQAPDLIQVTMMILEDSLSQMKSAPQPTQSQIEPITSAMSVLSALLALPNYSNRVWLYLRSATSIFGTDQSAGLISSALASERVTGRYTMTLALLNLVHRLFHEAVSTTLPGQAKLQQLKEDVLLRATRLIHTDIWIEHLGWKYSQLSDRFEIGHRVSALYSDILEQISPSSQSPFLPLNHFITNTLLLRAATSSLQPLISSICSAPQAIKSLYASRRFGDAGRLIKQLEAYLKLVRIVLNRKIVWHPTLKGTVLEQMLCTRTSGSLSSRVSNQSRVDPIEILMSYVHRRDVGRSVPIEAVLVLRSLCSSLSSQTTSITIVGHLSDPEATVASFVRIVSQPYVDAALRKAVWEFIALAVDKEPALARLLVTGKFQTPHDANPASTSKGESSKAKSAIDVASEYLAYWKTNWDHSPEILAAILQFLHLVWAHALEHKDALAPLRKDKEFWKLVGGICFQDLGPSPEHDISSLESIPESRRLSQHQAVAAYAHRATAKSLAVHILALDVQAHLQSNDNASSVAKPVSFAELEPKVKSHDDLNDVVGEAAANAYDPSLYDGLVQQLNKHLPGLSPDQLQSQEPPDQRELGESFTFSTSLLNSRIFAYTQKQNGLSEDIGQSLELQLTSLNLNLSLAHAQSALTDSWQALLQSAGSFFRGDSAIRPTALAISSSISFGIAEENRGGDMMAAIHGKRLSLLLSLLELAWFSTKDKTDEIHSFIDLIRNVHRIITNEAQPVAKSIIGVSSAGFHRPLLQVIYFCSRQSRNLARRPKVLNAEQRLTVSGMVEATLNLAIDALKFTFDSARARPDLDLDRDMGLLVAVFEQCTHRDINPSSTLWLARCQETDVIRAGLHLLTQVDLTGTSDLPLLQARKLPLYSPHILLFHMALASMPSSAERLASDGVLSAYSNNSLSAAISAGAVEVTLPELPGERNPGHRAYCSIISIVTAIINALSHGNHYFNAEASGFILLYGEQISKALSWTIEDPITFAFVEEMEQTVNLFRAIAENVPMTAKVHESIQKVLRAFTERSLLLLQQINYAISHPNHLNSLFEPVTAEERKLYEKDPSAEPLKRPIVAQLVHRLYRISSLVLTTLVAISRAELVLIAQQDDWPMYEAMVVPHSKVVLGEPASMGTLLELGNSTLDVLRELVNRPAGQSLTLAGAAPSSAIDAPLDVRQGVLTARRNLEGLLTYAVTQLIMWLSKPEVDSPLQEEDEMQLDQQRSDPNRERKPAKAKMSLGERLRRGMTGEMATDLQTLINKTKTIIVKTDGIIGQKTTDITQVLAVFLQERVSTAV